VEGSHPEEADSCTCDQEWSLPFMIHEDFFTMFEKIAIRQYHEAFLCVILPYNSIYNIRLNNTLQNDAQSSQAVYSF